eukprot:4287305-Amphidinium_carterae.1
MIPVLTLLPLLATPTQRMGEGSLSAAPLYKGAGARDTCQNPLCSPTEAEGPVRHAHPPTTWQASRRISWVGENRNSADPTTTTSFKLEARQQLLQAHRHCIARGASRERCLHNCTISEVYDVTVLQFSCPREPTDNHRVQFGLHYRVFGARLTPALMN